MIKYKLIFLNITKLFYMCTQKNVTLHKKKFAFVKLCRV